jgi:uncharacterized membrane protein YeiH
MAHPLAGCQLMGVITGVFGGVLRDILCNDVPSVFLKGECMPPLPGSAR